MKTPQNQPSLEYQLDEFETLRDRRINGVMAWWRLRASESADLRSQAADEIVRLNADVVRIDGLIKDLKERISG